MRLLMFGDPHCTRSCEFARPTEDGLNEYLQLFLKSFEFVVDTCKKEQPDILVFGGDFWDSRDFIDTMALNVGFRVWRTLNELDIKHKLAIVGNHDYWDIDQNIHTLEFLKGSGWTVFDSPGIIEINHQIPGLPFSVQTTKILGVPYRDKYDLEELQPLLDQKVDVTLTHFDVVGGMLRAPKNDGDSKAYTQSRALTPDLFKNSGIVLNSHYHHPSQVYENFFNIGALTSRTFADKNSAPRGVAIYDLGNCEYYRRDNPYARKFREYDLKVPHDVEVLGSLDNSNTYAKIYYDPDLIDEVATVSKAFAGTRLIPLKDSTEPSNTTQVDFRFSLEKNLENYIVSNYEDPELLVLALEILQESIEDYESSKSRLPLDFAELRIQNFQSLYSVTVNLLNQGLVFLRGVNDDDAEQDSNGSGKSSIIEAIYWCLTGKSLRGYKGNDVIRWGASFVRVELEVIVGEQKYTIIRSRKDQEYGTGVKLLLGDSSTGARLASDTQSKLKDIIGRSEKSLQHICFMTADLTHRFSALGYAERAKLLEEIIESEPYQIAKKTAKDRAFNVFRELNNLSGQIGKLTSVIEQRKSMLKESTEQLSAFDSNSSTTLVELDEQIKTIQSTIKILDAERVGIDPDVQDKLLNRLDEKLESLHTYKMDTMSELSNLKAKMQVITSNISRWKDLKNKELCPTCGEEVDTAKILSHIDHYLVQAQPIKVWTTEKEERLAMISDKEVLIKDKIKECKELRTVQVRRLSNIGVEINSRLRSVQETKERSQALLHKRSLISSAIDSYSKDIDQSETELEELASQEVSLREVHGQLLTLHSEVFGERGVRNSLLSQVAIPYINSKLPEYTQYLIGGRNLQLSASRTLKGGDVRNDIDIVQADRHTYTGSSSGERRRIDLCLQFALNDLSTATGRSRIGFLAVDEVLDKLDDSGIFAVKEILEKKAESSTIYMVSHSKYAASLNAKQIMVYKKDGRSYITEKTVSTVKG